MASDKKGNTPYHKLWVIEYIIICTYFSQPLQHDIPQISILTRYAFRALKNSDYSDPKGQLFRGCVSCKI